MGHRENLWLQAQSLFIKVKEMDGSLVRPLAVCSGIYHTDIVEAQGLEQGAQLVALEGRSRQVWENMWSNSCLNLHLPSSGGARAMVHAWLINIHCL
ncbi:hypothetical protein N665_1594s0008 [Sinapis alba]|nr:hypothetical protein N665_1594s0008 [Sinapis alba]